MCPDLFWPDAQVEVEAGLQQQVLHIIWVDSEVEVQRVSQQLVGFLITLPERNHTVQCKVPQPEHDVIYSFNSRNHQMLLNA